MNELVEVLEVNWAVMATIYSRWRGRSWSAPKPEPDTLCQPS